MHKQIAAINVLGRFLGTRDIDALSCESLNLNFGFAQADVAVLFGGSILHGGDVFAKAIQCGVAKNYVIVGGAGHTTETLRRRVHTEYPEISTAGLPEAEIFQRYLSHVYGCRADFLETESTNCGNNITNLLELLKRNCVPCESIILCQDATMQRRMEAGLQKHVGENLTIINYAVYRAEVIVRDGKLAYADEPHGMWEMDRYVNLLMGEIPRLADNTGGYGPNGKNFIAHVDIPVEVTEAFEFLKTVYGSETRTANPLYASKA